jgi:Galactose oxidase, central domain
MSTPRAEHTATLLANGTVLVAGGETASADTSGAEIYDAATGTWTVTGSMAAIGCSDRADRSIRRRSLFAGLRRVGALTGALIFTACERSVTGDSRHVVI